MNSPQASDETAAQRLAVTLRKAALAHERALLVELWAVEYFTRTGDVQAARRHREACHREATIAEDCYTRLAEVSDTRNHGRAAGP